MNKWTVNATKILSAGEIARVLADLKRRARRSVNSRQNLVIFRLATCCGLRVSELIGLRIGDVRVGLERPYILVRAESAKGRKGRRLALWWDQGTLDDLTAWRAERVSLGARPTEPFVCSHSRRSPGRPLDRQNARERFKVACRVLGAERVAELTIHHGRHSFVSHALAGGRSLAEVRDAAGHANIATTSLYAHVASDDGRVGQLFAFTRSAPAPTDVA
jgi:integrase/recombinase XerD